MFTKNHHHLWKSYVNVIQMLYDRGYDVSTEMGEDQKFKMNYEDFVEKYLTLNDSSKDVTIEEEDVDIRDNLKKIYKSGPQSKIKLTNIVVIWHIGNCGTNAIEETKNEMDNQQVKKCILILKGKSAPTSQAQTAIKNLKGLSPQAKKIIQHFSESELQYNPTEHILVPTHVLLTQDEMNKVLEEYGVSKNKFPSIKVTERISRHYGATIGQMFKIIRRSNAMPQIEDGDKVYQPNVISYRVVTV